MQPQRDGPDVLQIGAAPMVISQEMLVEVLPRWDVVMRAVHVDANATRDFGWVKEMFAFALAIVSLPSGVSDVLLDRCMMIQPPQDRYLAIDMEQVLPATSPYPFIFTHAIPAVSISILLFSKELQLG